MKIISMPNNILHIDADILLYRAGFGSEKRIKEEMPDGSIESRIEVLDVTEAFSMMDWLIAQIASKVEHEKMKFYITGPNNYRKNIATILEYEGNRKRSRKPIHFEALNRYLLDTYSTQVINGQEADDALGIALYSDPEFAIVASSDKDLRMVPGRHLVIKHDIEETHLVEIDETTGEYNFWMQMLEGDKNTDNILGCPQVGPKRAQGHLEGRKDSIDYWRTVKRVYLEQLAAYPYEGFELKGEDVYYPSWRTGAIMKKHIDEYLTEIGQLLWIRRKPMELWYPPTDKRSPFQNERTE